MRLIDADALKQDWLFRGDDGKPYRDTIDAQPTIEERKWIPCSERLPEPPSFCLVTTDGSHNDIIDIALYMSDGWHKASEVIAWMPLPEPYKEEK